MLFESGQGRHPCASSHPKDCGKAMIILADKKNQTTAGDSEENLFLFAYTQMSEDGTNGYNENHAGLSSYIYPCDNSNSRETSNIIRVLEH